jgi:hypothetical protein
MFLSKLLVINLIAVRLGSLIATCLRRAAQGCLVEELAGDREVWHEHCMTGGVFLVRRRHVDHGLACTCACPGSR